MIAAQRPSEIHTMTSVLWLLLLLLSGRSRFITTCVSRPLRHTINIVLSLSSSSSPVIERPRSRRIRPYFPPVVHTHVTKRALKSIFKRYADAPTRRGNAMDSGARLLEPWESRHGGVVVTKRKFAGGEKYSVFVLRAIRDSAVFSGVVRRHEHKSQKPSVKSFLIAYKYINTYIRTCDEADYDRRTATPRFIRRNVLIT